MKNFLNMEKFLNSQFIQSRQKSERRKKKLMKVLNLFPVLGILMMILSPLLPPSIYPETDSWASVKRYGCKDLQTTVEDYRSSRFLLNFYHASNGSDLAYSIYFNNPWDALNLTLIYKKTEDKTASYFPDVDDYNIDNLNRLDKRSDFRLESIIFDIEKDQEGEINSFNLTLETHEYTEFLCSTPYIVKPKFFWNKLSIIKSCWVYFFYSIMLVFLFCLNNFESNRFPIMSIAGGNFIQIVYMGLNRKLNDNIGENNYENMFIIGYLVLLFINIIIISMTRLKHRDLDMKVVYLVFLFLIPLILIFYSYYLLRVHLHFATIYITVVLITCYAALDCFFFIKEFRLFATHFSLLLIECFICLNVYDGFGQTLIPFLVFLFILCIIFTVAVVILWMNLQNRRAFQARKKMSYDPTDHLDLRRYSEESRRAIEQSKKDMSSVSQSDYEDQLNKSSIL